MDNAPGTKLVASSSAENSILVLLFGVSLVTLSCCVMYVYVVWLVQNPIKDMHNSVDALMAHLAPVAADDNNGQAFSRPTS